jgi:ATP-grasp domain
MKKNILVVRPCFEDFKELDKFSNSYNFLYHDYTAQELEETFHGNEKSIQEIVHEIAESYRIYNLAGVMYTSDFVGPALGSLIAKHLGLVGPDPATLFLCQHKYEARKAQQQFVPESVPQFNIFNVDNPESVLPDFGFPMFIKPIKSVFSNNAFMAHSMQEVFHYLQHKKPIAYERLFTKFIDQYTPYTFPMNYYLVEELLTGKQCTLEGIVYQGNVEILGIIDSIMFENNISFERFEYPSTLPQYLQEKMATIATCFIQGIGLDNSYFNIEFMCDLKRNTAHIIEINPRIAAQFTDLYEKVDGTSSYQWLLDLVVGNRPQIVKGLGKHNVSASFVLRLFQDHYVQSVPSDEQIGRFYDTFPDGRFELCCQKESKLSDMLQDSYSFMYGLIHLGAQSWEELYQNFEQAKDILSFDLQPVS